MSDTPEQVQIKAEHIHFWHVQDDNYFALRQIEGCEGLTDLPATRTDGQWMVRLMVLMGVPRENIHMHIGASFDELAETSKKIMKTSRALTVNETHHAIIAYFGGHGASHSEMQFYLLNSDDPDTAKMAIETKLRSLSDGEYAHVIGIFDCCRVQLAKKLLEGRGEAPTEVRLEEK